MLNMFKNLFFVCLMCLICFSAYAYEINCEDETSDIHTCIYEVKCGNEDVNIIKQIELDIDDCRFEDVFEYSDVDLIEYYNMQIICYQKIADKIFDNFYKEKNTEAKKIFAKSIEVFRFHYDNLFLQSDLAKVVRAGTMYEVQAYTYVSLKVKELLQEYIKEIKQQCKDASD